jgi:hypothetical protein
MSTENGPYGRWRQIIFYGAAGAIGVMTLLVLLTMLGCLFGFFGAGFGTHVQIVPTTGAGTGN